jgi:two-component system, LuxR family, response regulator FixJ
MTNENEQDSIVYIVDDDQAIRHAMGLLLRSVGLQHQVFTSADEFLELHNGNNNGCLVLDIRMPGLSGLELQQKLIEMGNSLPIIFISGHGDIPMAVEAMQKGAFDFIQKPFRDQELLDRISEALNTARKQESEREQKLDVQERIDTLTRREHEVLDLVVTGKPNKIIAHELGVSQRTIEIHRARVMEKMRAKSLAELVRMHMAA